MNTFHFSTVFMAILTSNILLAIIAAIISNKKILINAGYKLISIFLILTAVRFMLPIQFPFVTTFPLPQGISKIIIEFFAPRFTIGKYDISIFNCVILIWITGVCIQTYRFIRVDGMIKRLIFTFGKDVTNDPLYATNLNDTYVYRLPIRIFEVTGISTPFLYGFSKPYILVPSEQHISQQTLMYIIKHEISHYKHHDLWLKFGVQLLNIVYWWNPFTSLLNKQVGLVIEMRIDDNITDMNEKDAFAYLQSLCNMAEYQDTVLNHKMANVVSFTHHNETDLTRRFHMLMERRRKKNHGLNIILFTVTCIIYIFSYLFIFEAYYYIPEIAEYSLNFNEDTYLIDNGDGSYDLYFSGYKLETIYSTDQQSADIPIYTREEFERVQQKDPE